jgi:hypothetical protein
VSEVASKAASLPRCEVARRGARAARARAAGVLATHRCVSWQRDARGAAAARRGLFRAGTPVRYSYLWAYYEYQRGPLR